jgi:hypothetical protein
MPSDWASRNPTQRISYLNEQSVTPQDLENLGYSPSDIQWLINNGLGSPTIQPVSREVEDVQSVYTPAPASQSSSREVDDVAFLDYALPDVTGPSQPAVTQTPVTTPTTTTPTVQPTQQRDVLSMLPSNWYDFDATRKINWFNENNVSVDELLRAGVSQSDIDWILRNGYSPSSGGEMDDFVSLYEMQER